MVFDGSNFQLENARRIVRGSYVSSCTTSGCGCFTLRLYSGSLNAVANSATKSALQSCSRSLGGPINTKNIVATRNNGGNNASNEISTQQHRWLLVHRLRHCNNHRHHHAALAFAERDVIYA